MQLNWDEDGSKNHQLPQLPPIWNWFFRCIPSHLRNVFQYDDENLSLDELVEKADRLLVVKERAFTPRVTEFHEQQQSKHLGRSYERRSSASNYSRGCSSPSLRWSYDWSPRGWSRAVPCSLSSPGAENCSQRRAIFASMYPTRNEDHSNCPTLSYPIYEFAIDLTAMSLTPDRTSLTAGHRKFGQGC